nr:MULTISPECIES: hypothetical protein [unclassified Pseudomonas]
MAAAAHITAIQGHGSERSSALSILPLSISEGHRTAGRLGAIADAAHRRPLEAVEGVRHVIAERLTDFTSPLTGLDVRSWDLQVAADTNTEQQIPNAKVLGICHIGIQRLLRLEFRIEYRVAALFEVAIVDANLDVQYSRYTPT